MTDTLLRSVLITEIVLLGGALLAFVGHAVWYWATTKVKRPQILRGRALLVSAVEGPLEDVTSQEFAELPEAVKLTIFEEIAPRLEGSDRLRLMELADEIGIAASAAKLCRKRAWWKRLRGARIFTLVGGGGEVVPDLLDDEVPDVRAQAAEWAAWHPHPDTIRRLIQMLDDDRALSRFTVQDSLFRLGNHSVGPLAEALGTGEMTNLEAGLLVAARISDARFLDAGLRYADDAREGVRSRSAEVLGSVGGADAVSALLKLLEDPSAAVRAAATRALGKLGQWTSAPRLGELLEDPEWDVRREAALSLARFGAPGLLILRRAVKSDDGFARDMARQVLGAEGRTAFAP